MPTSGKFSNGPPANIVRKKDGKASRWKKDPKFKNLESKRTGKGDYVAKKPNVYSSEPNPDNTGDARGARPVVEPMGKKASGVEGVVSAAERYIKKVRK